MTRRIAGVALSMIAAAAASAAVTPLQVSVNASVRDASFVTIDSLLLAGPGQVDIGTVGNFDANIPEFGAAITVNFSVETIGQTRTVTVNYSTGGPDFVTQAAFDDMFDRPADGFYGIAFGLNFSDDEWDGDSTTRSTTSALLGDGVFIYSQGSPFFSASDDLTPSSSAFLDDVSPAGTGFFGGNVVVDEFRYVVQYQVVPAPGAAGMAVMGFGMVAARRRR